MNINLTLIGQLVSFAVFVWFTMKFVWPPIIDALESRKARIADGLAAAERGQHEQELAEKRAAEVLHEAKEQAAEIVNQGKKRASEIVDEAKDDARAEGQRLVHAAQAEIELETNRAREDLRSKVASLAITGAEQVLMREIDITAHNEVLDKLTAQL